MRKATAPFVLPLLRAIIFVGFSVRHGLSHPHCPDDDAEALLTVSYNSTSSWENRANVEIHIANSSPQMTITIIEDFTVEYPSNATFYFEKCIPRACGHIAVVGPPKDLYNISWDGQVIETGPELLAVYDKSHTYRNDNAAGYVVSTQFGDSCIPACDSGDHALFEYQYRSQFPDIPSETRSYFVEDQEGTEIIAGYDTIDSSGVEATAGLHVKHMCLPKNDCYRVVMGDRRQNVEHVTISFGNTTIFEDRPPMFESIAFGDSCPGVRSCDPDEESNVEFFMRRNLDPNYPDISWQLTSQNVSSGSQIIHRRDVPGNHSSTLHYDQICVPKDHCMAFSFMRESTSTDQADYMVRMDDIIYRATAYYRGKHHYDDDQSFYIGDCAGTNNSICEPFNKTLLELNFHTVPQPNSSRPDYPLSSDSYWAVYEMGEEYNDPFDPNTPVHLKDNFVYKYDSDYRVIDCIPSIQCAISLFVKDRNDASAYESYSIKMNGTLSTSETVVNKRRYGAEYEVTALDSDCDSPGLSNAVIAAIAVGVGLTIVTSILVIERSRRKYVPSIQAQLY